MEKRETSTPDSTAHDAQTVDLDIPHDAEERERRRLAREAATSRMLEQGLSLDKAIARDLAFCDENHAKFPDGRCGWKQCDYAREVQRLRSQLSAASTPSARTGQGVDLETIRKDWEQYGGQSDAMVAHYVPALVAEVESLRSRLSPGSEATDDERESLIDVLIARHAGTDLGRTMAENRAVVGLEADAILAAGYRRSVSATPDAPYPKAEGNDALGGWTIKPSFLDDVRNRAVVCEDECAPSWETTEGIILAYLALRALSGAVSETYCVSCDHPACGALFEVAFQPRSDVTLYCPKHAGAVPDSYFQDLAEKAQALSDAMRVQPNRGDVPTNQAESIAPDNPYYPDAK